jgi:peptidoglycan/xylan/chitin deacetylase (PgdA/CDA1 family)
MRPTRIALTATLVLGALSLGCTGVPSTSPTPPTGTASTTVTPTPTGPVPTSPVPTVTSPPPTTAPPPTTSPPTTPPGLPGSLLGKDLEKIPTSQKVIALTFDAGANGDAVASILATLAQEGITATFFLTGDFVNDFPGPSQQIAAAGHRLGNHTVNHPQMTALSDAQARAEVFDAEADILAVTGADPAPWFRFPYGDRNAHTIALVNDCGYIPIRWTVDSLGWQGTMGGTRNGSFVANRVLNATTPGGIVLMHVGSHPTDGSTLDADALPAIIDGLRDRGYSFVTLDALLT